jgi:sugar fermentation stimulation protein A
MLFPSPLLPGVLLRRYKRFLADVRLSDGREITAHCPNPGAMTGYASPGLEVLLSRSDDPRRKLAHTWELVHAGGGWIGVNAARANAVVEEGLRSGVLAGFADYPDIRREAAYGSSSRVDFLLSGPAGLCYLEVKSVTLLAGDGCYAFPDAVTERGLKHLRDLSDMAAAGHRAVVVFLIQRADAVTARFRAAHEVDPAYARGLAEAAAAGVEVMPWGTRIDPAGIHLGEPVPWLDAVPAAAR